MRPSIKIARVKDFKISGSGKAQAWRKTRWHVLSRVAEGKLNYHTRAKVLYSASGIYFLFDCEDRKLTCRLTRDFSDIYTEDVVEVFLWPDTSQNIYFEYEASPLGVQLPLLVSNNKGRFFGWRPWHFEGDRLTRVRTSVRGGRPARMANVRGWSAEFYIPFKLLDGLGNTPPSAGTIWRANMYRIDYDELPQSHWAWAVSTGRIFHDFHNFGTFKFE